MRSVINILLLGALAGASCNEPKPDNPPSRQSQPAPTPQQLKTQQLARFEERFVQFEKFATNRAQSANNEDAGSPHKPGVHKDDVAQELAGICENWDALKGDVDTRLDSVRRHLAAGERVDGR